MHAAGRLTDSLKSLGLPLRRFKTGTPPRVLRRSVDFDEMELQEGDALPVPFSYATADPPENRAVCYLTWTTEETRRIVRETLDRAPMYSGVIEGVGPRYCPSFETKVVRFPDKLRHQLFVEPMGLDTEELYIQGFSSSMPEEVQLQMLHSVPGLTHAEMTRPAYAIEYECIDPLALTPALESRPCLAYTAPGSSTAPPATRRPPFRACAPGSTPCGSSGGSPPSSSPGRRATSAPSSTIW
jgi:tRNA uridine 5-carboxymethylaminomethyl modification enzyme